ILATPPSVSLESLAARQAVGPTPGLLQLCDQGGLELLTFPSQTYLEFSRSWICRRLMGSGFHFLFSKCFYQL
ncbi:MAG: hypothetical protein ACUVRZ_12905, partial [Desulfobacca sp.]|uniref:hypothetical protein n=1 Tax=Desulfobacca sp. TaxID=2067990 RepID=UPI00404A718D